MDLARYIHSIADCIFLARWPLFPPIATYARTFSGEEEEEERWGSGTSTVLSMEREEALRAGTKEGMKVEDMRVARV
jgi:hypothetical protein